MALPPNIADREHRKFVEDADGDVGVRLGPNAIKDTEGNTLGLDSEGRASTQDHNVYAQLKNIHGVLEDIRFQLELITGADLNG